MPENVRCETCGTVVLGYVLGGEDPRPIGDGTCPECDGPDFTPLDGRDDEGATTDE